MIDNLLKHSVIIKRRSISVTTRRDTLAVIATVDSLIQAVSNTSDVSTGNEIGKEYIIFFQDGIDIQVGDLIVFGAVNFKIDSIQERNSLYSSNNFYSTRATKMDTNSLIS